MAERVFTAIKIGGRLELKDYEVLCGLIADERLWPILDGVYEACPFEPDDLIEGEPLHVYSNEASWGRFDSIEAFCCSINLAFERRSGAAEGVYGAERTVFDGANGPFDFGVDDIGEIVIGSEMIGQLGSMRKIRSYLKRASFTVPPLNIVRA